jgi:hypothetical protein
MCTLTLKKEAECSPEALGENPTINMDPREKLMSH